MKNKKILWYNWQDSIFIGKMNRLIRKRNRLVKKINKINKKMSVLEKSKCNWRHNSYEELYKEEFWSQDEIK